MRMRKVENIGPRNGQTHGLFGYRFLKHHKMRDQDWTANDLIEQYDRICGIFEKANENKNLKKEHKQLRMALLYKDLRKELKDKDVKLQTILKGDVQRTKNVLQNFPEYMRIYQNKQSFEVLEELDFKTYHMQKTLDRYTGERNQLIKEYEERLVMCSLITVVKCIGFVNVLLLLFSLRLPKSKKTTGTMMSKSFNKNVIRNASMLN
jgi:hypothetical protein